MQALFNKLEGDKIIWSIVFVLSLFSLLTVYSATGTLAFQQQGGNTEYYLFKQLVVLVVGFCFMYVAHIMNYHYYSRIAQLLLYISLPLLALTLFFGTNIHDARRWLTVPIIGFSFQTSDLGKLALIMFTARMLSKKQHIIDDIQKAYLPIVIPIIGTCILIIPSDLSTGLLLLGTCLILMFIGRVRLRHIVLTLLVSIIVFFMYIGIASLTSYEGRVKTWQSRVESFMDASEDSYQTQQAKIAIANGGIIRLAPGKSRQRNFLPQPYSDFIYAIMIEEYGLLGGGFILVLYLLLLWRCIKIFARSPGAFGALLAVGLGVSIVIQALMNMAVTVDLLPVTGLTLPFVSMGGTSLFFNSIAIGIILSVSRDVEKQESLLLT